MSGWKRSNVLLGAAVLATCAVLSGLAGCSKRDRTPAHSSAQILRLSQRNEPGTLDPAQATLPDEFAILRTLEEGLLTPGPDGTTPRPGVAPGFEISPDRLTYTFRLRPEARWSNGDPVTAGDFIASYRRLLTPSTAAPKSDLFDPVRNARAFARGELTDFSAVGFHAPDNHTLVITLERPAPRFPHYVASGPWLPVHPATVEQHGRQWTEPENFVGNGPFTLVEWRPDQRIVVRKNPRWHGASAVKLAEIHFMRFDSGDSEERAYRAGQIHATMSVPGTKLETYDSQRPAELHRAPMIETRYLAFNTRRPPLDDVRVRRALALAIDRQKIVERVKRGGQPAAGRILPAALRDATDTRPLPGEHGHDPDAARRLLAEAGLSAANWPGLELTGWSETPVLEAVQAMWQQELGISVTIAVREARVHLDALSGGRYDIAFITAIPDVADAANLLADFRTGSPGNYPQWSDAAFDQELAAARGIADGGRRARLLRGAEDRLLAAAPITPLYFNTKIWLMSPEVRGWQEDGLWSRSFHTIYLDDNGGPGSAPAAVK